MKPIYYLYHASPLGQLTLAATDLGLCAAYFHDQRSYPDTSAWIETSAHPMLDQAARELDEYFAAARHEFEVPLDLSTRGTAFQKTVWRTLLDIRYGSTSNYATQARLIDNPRAVRAVGGAIGRNPVSIIVPCHRVVGSNGALTGYDGGLARKQYLLRLEGVGSDR